MMQQSSCTEDRIQHVLERCLCHLTVDTPDKQLWNAGLCVSRWSLEELVKRDPHNFLVLLRIILRKTNEVLEQCQYEMVVPLTLLFSSTLLRVPYVASNCIVLQEAYWSFQRFLSWPEPCSSACKHLLEIIQQELQAPGITFQRLVRTEQDISLDIHCDKTITVLMLNPEDEVPPEVQSASEQMSTTHQSNRDITTNLILHSFQAALGSKCELQALRVFLQNQQPEELQHLLEVITGNMETAVSSGDQKTTRDFLRKMETLRESLATPTSGTSTIEMFKLPFPKCHTCTWDTNNFDFLKDLLVSDSDVDSPSECFLSEISQSGLNGDDSFDTSVDEEDELDSDKGNQEFLNHRISTVSSSSRDSAFSNFSLSSSWSVPSASSGVDSDIGEDTEEPQERQLQARKKPKKKSKSLLGIERFSMLFKTPQSPGTCRRVQSMGFHGDIPKDLQRTGSQLKQSRPTQKQVHHPTELLAPRKHVCIRRRAILSCDEGASVNAPTLVKVVVFGGDREAGRLARAYSDLQQKESRCPRLTRMCKLKFYFVPTKRRTGSSSGRGDSPTEGQTGNVNKAVAPLESYGFLAEDSTTDIAHMLGLLDPWYERNVLSLLSLSSDVLSQDVSKNEDVSANSESPEHLFLLTDLVLYYCRNADQPVLVQLYQAELTLSGGMKRKEVFIHSLELGHTAGIRAVKAMGAASKRLGIDGDKGAVPLTLTVAYNKVAVSGRSQWVQAEMVCTSVNLSKACRKPEELASKESLQLTMMGVAKKQCSKSKKHHNQQQIFTSVVKVDKLQVMGGNEETTFAVCLDQDEKKFIQSVTRCDVSLCSKPGSGSDWKTYKPLPGQIQPLNPTYCSLLCLPITSFSSSYL